ncbi:MAG TPA: Ig-like domain repeat protein [Candidatus Sulfotelmatobacter sp.]|nr:Ig-like domain repeat protein [Candidatus Sulfotelmatobacter sp.]
MLEPVDNQKRVTVPGNVHPWARAEFDAGAAPLDLVMDRMLLVLKRSPEQQAQLRKLLDDQQDKHSRQYRKWLTPGKFGEQFGPADGDMQKVTAWLETEGFHNIVVSKGRTVIEFSGTAGLVQSAFATPIRKFVVGGESHWANSSEPSIPQALAPVVAGVFTLHDFHKRPQVHLAKAQFTAKALQSSHPVFTSSSGAHALGPADYYTIYNFNPLGSGLSKIAIIGRTNINLQDVSFFHYWMYDQATPANVILNGPDPGDLGGDEEAEAVLDTTWAGAVAPSDWITLVVSQSTATTDGVDLSKVYIIDNNLADVMSESFGDCEAHYTSTQAAGMSSLAQQAAAEGITYVVASGDSGAAGCDNPNTQKTATQGLSVNVLASSPYTVAVGGTVFNENGHNSTYWSSSNAQGTQESAISYIPEDVWNDSCASCSKPNIWAGGGGASSFFAKPSWQTGVAGIPSDGARDLPDVSLTAAAHDPYLICLRGSCTPNAQGVIFFYGASGTSASAPAFAGIMGLVANHALTRLGQPNYVLYRLAAAETLSQCNASATTLPAGNCVFNDVTVGNNAVPGEANYGTSSAKYQSAKGYDLATGLGSVNVTNLINQWNTVTFNPTTTTFSISPTSAVHGSAMNVSGAVTPSSGAGTATGVVWLSNYPAGNIAGQGTIDIFNLGTAGTYSGVTHLLPGGTYQVDAHYAGDATYGGSDSAPPVQVSIQPENTSVTFSVLTTDSGGNLVPFSAGPYGTPVYFQAHVAGQSGYGTPGSYVNFWDNNGSGAGPAWLDSNANALTPALTAINAGTHSITAGYYGDNSFNSSLDLTPINFTISQLATTTAVSSQKSAESLLITAAVTANGMGAPATGAVNFTSGGAALNTAALVAGATSNGTTQATAAFDATQLPPGQYNITASYPGDANYSGSSSTNMSLNLVADFTVADRGLTSQTVTAGQTASYINDLGVNPFFGFSSTVNVSCSVPAQGTTCSINPNSYTLGSGPGVGTISVSTTSRSAALAVRSLGCLPGPGWFATATGLLLYLAAFAAPGRKPRAAIAAFLLVLPMAFGLLACGGGSGPGGTGGSGTPAGNYAVTVTGTSGAITHTATFTLIVQ